MPKIAIITLSAKKDEYLVAWINEDMTIQSFCKGHIRTLQDAKKSAGAYLVNSSVMGETSFINYSVTVDRDVLYWDYDSIKCPEGTKVRPVEIPLETAKPALTYSEISPHQEGWYWMRSISGFERIKRVFTAINTDELCVWIADIQGKDVVRTVESLNKFIWAGPIPKPEGRIKHA